MVNNKWYPLAISQSKLEGGYDIVITTDVACHQWLRWSETIPQKHAKPIYRRGTVVSYDVRFCFVVFHDIEQEEAGDTHTHTFIWRDWVHCQMRWFYFWATIGGETSPSTTAWFSKHYTWEEPPPEPECLVFTPDRHPESTSVDGRVFRVNNNGESWFSLIDGGGNYAEDSITVLGLQVGFSDETQNLWRVYMRSILLFDISAIPAGSTIVSAKLSLYQTGKTDDLFISAWFSVGVYESYPNSNTALVPADYSRIHSVCLTDNPLIMDDSVQNDWNDIPLNEAGIAVLQAHLNSTGIAKLGIREKTYDADRTSPPWLSTKYSLLYFATSESPPFGPKLEVCYRPP